MSCIVCLRQYFEILESSPDLLRDKSSVAPVRVDVIARLDVAPTVSSSSSSPSSSCFFEGETTWRERAADFRRGGPKLPLTIPTFPVGGDVDRGEGILLGDVDRGDGIILGDQDRGDGILLGEVDRGDGILLGGVDRGG